MLSFLSAHVAMSCQYFHEGKEFPNLALREGDCSRLRVSSKLQDFLDSGPFSLLRQEFLTLAKSLDSPGRYGKIHLRA